MAPGPRTLDAVVDMPAPPPQRESDPEELYARIAPRKPTLLARSFVSPVTVTPRATVRVRVSAGRVGHELVTQIHGGISCGGGCSNL
jgi:hypothetical protein